MKFLSMTITLSRNQYVITNRPTIWQKMAMALTVLAIIMVSLQSGCEHIGYIAGRQITRQFENIAVNMISGLIAPRGRVYCV